MGNDLEDLSKNNYNYEQIMQRTSLKKELN